jgi:uncharacterized protein YndB with AHSA1/START domain
MVTLGSSQHSEHVTRDGQVFWMTENGKRVTSKIQGCDEITVEAPVERVWPLIADSTLLPDWGPPVKGVTLFGPAGQAEGLGSRRRVDAEFDGRRGHFIERRIQHIEGQKIAFVIEEETFGLFRVMTETGSSIEIRPNGPNQTRVIWTFFHNAKGLMGHIMNRLVVLRQQRRNRLAALTALKRHAETLGY